MLESTQQRARNRAQEAAHQTASSAKEEFGRVMFDALEEYFPEEAKARRNQRRLTMLLVGVAIGVVLEYLISR